MADLKYEIRRDEGLLTFIMEGELDMHVAPALRQAFHEKLAAPPPRVIVDLANVPFVDSSIVATLVEALKLVRKGGGELRIVNCQPPVRDTFEIARLLDSFGIE